MRKLVSRRHNSYILPRSFHVRAWLRRKTVKEKCPTGTSCCCVVGLVASLQAQDASSIPGLAQWTQWIKGLQLWLRLHLRLRSDPRPRNFICRRVAKKEKEKKKSNWKHVKKHKGSEENSQESRWAINHCHLHRRTHLDCHNMKRNSLVTE